MRLGAFDQTVTVDPIVVDGQAVGTADAITGTAPPPGKRVWWPWLVAGGALLAAWWYVEQSGEGRKNRPLADA